MLKVIKAGTVIDIVDDASRYSIWLIFFQAIFISCFIHAVDYLLYWPVIYFFPIVTYIGHYRKPVQTLYQKNIFFLILNNLTNKI